VEGEEDMQVQPIETRRKVLGYQHLETLAIIHKLALKFIDMTVEAGKRHTGSYSTNEDVIICQACGCSGLWLKGNCTRRKTYTSVPHVRNCHMARDYLRE
jgi:hypothetical protein